MTIKATDLVAKFRQAYEERWGYIYGTRGQVWTQAQQDKATREQTQRYGQQWVGRRVADCSGLAVWAFKALGGKIYHGSNTIFSKYCSQTGPLVGEVNIRIGTAVFQNKEGRRPHIGYYDGNGMCIEAQGTRTGIVRSPLASWDEWGLLKDVDYEGLPWEKYEVTTPQTTREGDAGELVEYIQLALIEAGFDDLTPDGHFGARTKAAVIAFQTSRGLEGDGVVGPDTWAALRAITEDDEPDEDADDGLDADEPGEPAEPPVTEPRATLRQGSKGEDVRGLQGMLNTWHPQLQLKVDGKFGAATHAAVISFQQAHGLTADGIVGPDTWCVLLRLDVDPSDDDQEPDVLAPEDQESEVGQDPTSDSDCVQSPSEALDGLVPGRAETDVAALMAAVDKAMTDLKAAVAALVDGVGRG